MNDGLKDRRRKTVIDILAAHPGVERAALFGSRASPRKVRRIGFLYEVAGLDEHMIFNFLLNYVFLRYTL